MRFLALAPRLDLKVMIRTLAKLEKSERRLRMHPSCEGGGVHMDRLPALYIGADPNPIA